MTCFFPHPIVYMNEWLVNNANTISLTCFYRLQTEHEDGDEGLQDPAASTATMAKCIKQGAVSKREDRKNVSQSNQKMLSPFKTSSNEIRCSSNAYQPVSPIAPSLTSSTSPEEEAPSSLMPSVNSIKMGFLNHYQKNTPSTSTTGNLIQRFISSRGRSSGLSRFSSQQNLCSNTNTKDLTQSFSDLTMTKASPSMGTKESFAASASFIASPALLSRVRKGSVSAETKIQEELREMRVREEELKLVLLHHFFSCMKDMQYHLFAIGASFHFHARSGN